nr:immunoglobulin light chain junction region [Macaca mulatta]MOV67302.1 immunoglobulin light chain junction region [Macaca mulatta]MOV68244.1 immunoglobulin light chain junction region [Macaca mulatta]MOV68261.1 immunoglobulin light chain junction region [Macaca mulatta]MOV68371.1 immunoglobulin light chain junction region [Macaca mulatta]
DYYCAVWDNSLTSPLF